MESDAPEVWTSGTFSLELRADPLLHACSGAEVTDRSTPDWLDIEVSDWELGERHRRLFWARFYGSPDDVRVDVELGPDRAPPREHWAAAGRRLSHGVPLPGGRVVVDVRLSPSLSGSGATLSGSIERPVRPPEAPADMAIELSDVVGADGARLAGAFVSINVELGGVPRIAALQSELRPGWRLFLSDWTADWSRATVSAAPARSEWDVLRWLPTEAVNHRLTAQDIALRLRAMRERWPFALLGARHDAVLLELPEPIRVEDAQAFAQQLWDLCPDLVRCGFADVEALARYVSQRGPEVTRHLLELWWD